MKKAKLKSNKWDNNLDLSNLGGEGSRELYPPVGNTLGSVLQMPMWHTGYVDSQIFYKGGRKEKSRDF